MAEVYKWSQEDARALVEAGYLPLDEYLRLCRENGWAPRDGEQGSNKGSSARLVSAAPSNITFAASRKPRRQNITR